MNNGEFGGKERTIMKRENKNIRDRGIERTVVRR